MLCSSTYLQSKINCCNKFLNFHQNEWPNITSVIYGKNKKSKHYGKATEWGFNGNEWSLIAYHSVRRLNGD